MAVLAFVRMVMIVIVVVFVRVVHHLETRALLISHCR
jgi:hypothetical protein